MPTFLFRKNMVCSPFEQLAFSFENTQSEGAELDWNAGLSKQHDINRNKTYG
jgi:hypothetical protein